MGQMTSARADKHILGYGNGPRQVVQIISPPASSSPPLLIFIHGGAWRSESIQEHLPMAENIAREGIAVALIEYRLSLRNQRSGEVTDQHPAHLEDIFLALRLLLSEDGNETKLFDVDRVVLAGHSVGAWMALAALLDSDAASTNGLPPIPSLGTALQRRTIRSRIKAWIGLDGIYDVQSLLREYPDYAGFVSQAFIDEREGKPLPDDGPGSDPRLASVSLPAWPFSRHNALPHVYIAHSKDDELLTFQQSIEASEQLVGKFAIDERDQQQVTVPSKSNGVAGVGNGSRTVIYAPPYVNVDFTSLTGKHRPMLETDAFVTWISRIVKAETGSGR